MTTGPKMFHRAGGRVGEDHQNAKLSDHEVELVRRLRAEGMSYDRIAAKMGVSKSSIADICTWRRRAVLV
jgi:predicted DNA-binding protein (UPF0251 family)